MKTRARSVDQLRDRLQERFGDPLGPGLDEPSVGPAPCARCGGRLAGEELICDDCGLMEAELPLSDIQAARRRPDPKDPRTTRDPWGRPVGRWTGETIPREPKPAPERSIDEVTPPGRERQVRALKRQKNVDNPWAVAWASYDRSR